MCAYCVYYQIVTHWTIFNTTYGVCFLIFNHCVLLHVHTRKYHLHIYNLYNSLYQFKQIETLKRFPVISQGGLIMACGRWGGTTAPPWLILYPLKKPIKSSHFCLYQVITPQMYKKSFRSLIRTLWCYMLVIYIYTVYIYIYLLYPQFPMVSYTGTVRRGLRRERDRLLRVVRVVRRVGDTSLRAGAPGKLSERSRGGQRGYST